MLIDSIDKFGCFSVLSNTEGVPHREALMPGQWERAKEILPDELLAQVEKIWTPKVVEKWERLQEQELQVLLQLPKAN